MIVPRDRDSVTGEPLSVVARWGPILGFLLMFAIQTVSFAAWLSGIRSDVNYLMKSQTKGDTTPSQWDIQFKADIEVIRARQMEVLARLVELDKVGTQGLRILEQRIKQDEVVIDSLNSRCADSRAIIDQLKGEVIELKIRYQDLISVITPHSTPHKSKNP